MKKKILKPVSIVLAACLLLGITATAAVTSKEIKALQSTDIKVVYDGRVQTLKDANNKTVYPIVYEGTTYLPIRAISNLFNVPVDWSSEYQTVILGQDMSKEVELQNLREEKFYDLDEIRYDGKYYSYIDFVVEDVSKFYYFGIESNSSYDAPRIVKVLDPDRKEVKYSAAKFKESSIKLSNKCDEFKYSYSNKFVKRGRYRVLFSDNESHNYEFVKAKCFYTDYEIK